MWRKGCSASTLEPPEDYWEVLSQAQNQAVRAVTQAGTLSRRSLEGREFSYPSARSLVSHSNPSWPPEPRRRGGASPWGGSGQRLGRAPAVPKQGSPGHTQPPARIRQCSPAPVRCAPPQSPPDEVSALRSPARARRSLGDLSLRATHLVVPPERSHPPNSWACQSRVEAQGSLEQQPPEAQAVGQ